MKNIMLGSIKHLAKTVGYGLLGAFIVVVIAFVWLLNSRPDLKIWHEAHLDAEFTVSSSAETFEEYMAIEGLLFDQLEEQVYKRIDPEDKGQINRFHKGSLSDPRRWSPNWNRSFELTTTAPKIGVLLLHGMSDSPYSLHGIGQKLHAGGAWVVGLRIPGHGTAPSGLVRVKWEDMAAAVQLAMKHLHTKMNGRPIYIVGYSNGSALAVNYSLTALEDNYLPAAAGLILISPSIGVTPFAALAAWQGRLGRWMGFHKLAWNAILPEYDPFKYGSFAVNAGEQVHRLTNKLQGRLNEMASAGNLNKLPQMLAFQSIVDATVSTRAVVDGLFAKIPQNGSRLVIFDINRVSGSEILLSKKPGAEIKELMKRHELSFTVDFVTNTSGESREVIRRRKEPGQSGVTTLPLGMEWPAGIYSLSHVALPFSSRDPLYGRFNDGRSPGIHLGNIALRGEKGVLQVPASDMLRLRWNPFYPELERQIFAFCRLSLSDE
jgi:alpha-beta hydrolase superfamily lysophospholipase